MKVRVEKTEGKKENGVTKVSNYFFVFFRFMFMRSSECGTRAE